MKLKKKKSDIKRTSRRQTFEYNSPSAQFMKLMTVKIMDGNSERSDNERTQKNNNHLPPNNRELMSARAHVMCAVCVQCV